MATSVKLTEDYKRRLDRLRESLSRIEGDSVSLQETLQRAIDLCSAKPDLLRSSQAQVQYPLPASRIRAIHAIANEWGSPSSEEDIDLTLYGGRKRRRS